MIASSDQPTFHCGNCRAPFAGRIPEGKEDRAALGTCNGPADHPFFSPGPHGWFCYDVLPTDLVEPLRQYTANRYPAPTTPRKGKPNNV